MKLYLFVSTILISFSAYSHLLIIQFSDTQSQYDRIPIFINAISHRMHVFKEKYPDGKLLVLENGDIGGMSEYSKYDGGYLDYSLLSSFNKNIPVVLGLGPHQAFDFQSYKIDTDSPYRDEVSGSMLFLYQNKRLGQVMKTRFHPFPK